MTKSPPPPSAVAVRRTAEWLIANMEIRHWLKTTQDPIDTPAEQFAEQIAGPSPRGPEGVEPTPLQISGRVQQETKRLGVEHLKTYKLSLAEIARLRGSLEGIELLNAHAERAQAEIDSAVLSLNEYAQDPGVLERFPAIARIQGPAGERLALAVIQSDYGLEPVAVGQQADGRVR